MFENGPGEQKAAHRKGERGEKPNIRMKGREDNN